MSYYMGDYYAGDPGIGSFFGGLAKKAVGIATSFIPGVGPLVSRGVSAVMKGREIVKPTMTAAAGRVAGTIVKHPVLSAAGAVGALGAAGVVGKRMGAAGAAVRMMPGAHKKRRRMNPCNVRALRRASRRAHAFLKISSKLVRYYQPHKKKGHPFIKHKKRAA